MLRSKEADILSMNVTHAWPHRNYFVTDLLANSQTVYYKVDCGDWEESSFR